MAPTLLLPGLDGTGRLFAPLLAAGLPGRVVPIPPSGAQGYPAWLRQAEAALLATPGRAVMVAESYSSPVGLRLAAAHPERVAALVLVSSFAGNPLTPAWRRLAAWGLPLAFAWPAPRLAVRRLLAGPRASDGLVEEIRAAIHSVPPPVLRGRVMSVLELDAAWTWAAGRPRCPVLVLHGTEDRLVAPPPEWGPHLRLVRGPHLLLQSAPEDCARTIGEFLAAQAGGENQSA